MIDASGGGIGHVVRSLGGRLLAPHMDAKKIAGSFGSFEHVDVLVKIAEVGVPIAVGPGGDLKHELAYGNHPSAQKWHGAIWQKVVEDVEAGRAVLFKRKVAEKIPGLRVSPVGVVEEKEKLRVIHDLTIPVAEATGGEGRPVNATTFFEEIPACGMATVMKEVLERFLGLRARYPRRTILLQKMDVQSVFRQIPVDPGCRLSGM